jgi:hypothetical protein
MAQQLLLLSCTAGKPDLPAVVGSHHQPWLAGAEAGAGVLIYTECSYGSIAAHKTELPPAVLH